MSRAKSLGTEGPAPSKSARSTRQRFDSLPAVARAYVALVVAAGALSLVAAVVLSGFDRPAALAVLTALALAASAVKLDLPLTYGTSSLSISYAVDFAALLILGAPEATTVAAAGAWSQCTFRIGTPNALHRTLFSIAALAVTLQGAGVVFQAAQGGSDTLLYGFLRPLAFAALAYWVLNTALVAGAIGLSTGQNPAGIWLNDFMWSAPSYFVGAGAAGIVAAADRFGYSWWLLMVAVPCYLTYHSYRLFIERIDKERLQARRASDVQMAIIEALATAIEAKDRTSHTQMNRMQKYSAALARAAGFPADELPGLQTATLLHDIGNLAVPEHILAKTGPLTKEEWEKVRIHPRVGAEILAKVPFPYPVAPLILRHHEHWDGSGYPGGLRGEEIPLGARILAVVDSYFSLSTHRPHRPALSEAEVLANMRNASGRILDPRLVDVFLTVLPEIERAAADPAASGAAASETLPAKGGALEDIAVAHQEALSLYQIAQALGSSLAMDETMNLVVASLRVLVPFSSFALFLENDARRGFVCRHADGVANDRLKQLRIASPADIGATLDQVNKGARQDEMLRYVAAASLDLNGTTIGLIAVYHASRDYRTDDRRVLVRVAAQAAPVIHNSVVFEKTQQESYTDHLTGLPNRRAMMMYLRQQIGRAERRRSKLTLVMLDLNDFKEVNDRLGHQRGDHVLREIAAVLRSMVRAYDLCVRFGGDEFVVILWECDAEQADRRLRELKDGVKAAYFESQPGESIRLSASAGFAVYPDDGLSQEELISVADRRMYENKASRRTSTADGPSPLAEGPGPDRTAAENGATRAPAPLTAS